MRVELLIQAALLTTTALAFGVAIAVVLVGVP